jgi:hypothetical protein
MVYVQKNFSTIFFNVRKTATAAAAATAATSTTTTPGGKFLVAVLKIAGRNN